MQESEIVKIQSEFRIGYGARSLLMPGRESQWSVAFAKSRRPIRSLAEEGVLAARALYEKYKEPISVFYSGGIDSEFAVHCFRAAGVPFQIITCVFADSLNRHDLEYVAKLRKSYPDLDYKELVLDVRKFLHSPLAKNYARESFCSLPHLLGLMWLVDQVQSPIVIAIGEPYLKLINGTWYLREREAIASVYRFFHHRVKKGTPLFFQSTPEIFAAYLTEPALQDLTSHKRPGKLSSLSSRIDIYSRYFPIEPRLKYHGYEHLESQIARLQCELETEFSERRNILYWRHEELKKAVAF